MSRRDIHEVLGDARLLVQFNALYKARKYIYVDSTYVLVSDDGWCVRHVDGTVTGAWWYTIEADRPSVVEPRKHPAEERPWSEFPCPYQLPENTVRISVPVGHLRMCGYCGHLVVDRDEEDALLERWLSDLAWGPKEIDRSCFAVRLEALGWAEKMRSTDHSSYRLCRGCKNSFADRDWGQLGRQLQDGHRPWRREKEVPSVRYQLSESLMVRHEKLKLSMQKRRTRCTKSGMLELVETARKITDL